MAPRLLDGVDWRLHDEWRSKLSEAERHFKEHPNDETKAEYMRILKIFKDLVMHGILPRG